MPGESMINEDGEVLVGEDGYELTSDDADECVECCGGVDPCEAPPRMSVCAAYDLFNLAPAPGDASRRQVLLPLPDGGQTTMDVELRAEIDWSGRGGEEFGDILSYVLKTGGLNDPLASEIVPLAPVVQQDAGGCWRIVEWRRLAVLWFTQVINTSGAKSTYTVGACVHLTMTADGWAFAIDIIDGTREGTFVFRRPGGGAGDAKGGFGDSDHKSTLEGLGQTRVPLASQVVSGRGTNMTAGLGDYLEPPAGVSPRGCPPFLGALSVRASPGVKCAPGQVFAPGRFRMRWRAVYDQVQIFPVYNGEQVTNHYRATEDYVVEWRNPYSPPETERTVVQSEWTYRTVKTVNGVVQQDYTDTGTLGGGTTALADLNEMVVENQRIGATFGPFGIGINRNVSVSGCAGRTNYVGPGPEYVTQWNGKDSLTRREAHWTIDLVGSDVSSHSTCDMEWTLEPIDELTCSGPGIVPPMPAVRTLGEAGELVGRLVRGEL